MFNDPIAVQRFKQIINRYGVASCVETGTHQGVGALRIAEHVPCVTVEIDPKFRNEAIDMWIKHGYSLQYQSAYAACLTSRYGFIFSTLGDSETELHNIIRSFPQPMCFYLDAHWHEKWPLRRELTAIANHHLWDCPIIIHDCRVPGTDLGYDVYDGVVLDYMHVADLLSAINPHYHICYNYQAEGNKRGILYALP